MNKPTLSAVRQHYNFIYSSIGLQDSKGVTDIMSLLDDFAMDLASDMEKRSPTNVSNATIDVKMVNVGE